jgi:hypothetical protein
MRDSAPIKLTFRERDRWLRAVLASDLPHTAARVAAALALHLNVTSGRCNPGHKALADHGRVSERTAYRLVELLERAGWIAIKRASGRPNQYVLLTPDRTMAGVGALTPVRGDRATPAKNGPDPCHTVADNKRTSESTSEQKMRGATKVAPSHLERERDVVALAGSLGGAAGAVAPQAADEPKPVNAPLTGEILPPDDVNTLAALLAIWNRGHAADRAPAAQQRVREAWERACRVAEPATILDGARKTVAAADAPRFLPKLDEWLDARGWAHPPPPKRRPRRAGSRTSKRNSGGSGIAFLDRVAKEGS